MKILHNIHVHTTHIYTHMHKCPIPNTHIYIYRHWGMYRHEYINMSIYTQHSMHMHTTHMYICADTSTDTQYVLVHSTYMLKYVQA